MSQRGNAGKDLVQIGRNYFKYIQLNILSDNWGVVIIALLFVPLSLYGLKATVDNVARVVGGKSYPDPRQNDTVSQPTPAIPIVQKPAIPTVQKPAIPTVQELAIPIVQKPAIPTVQELAIPTVQKPAIPTVQKPAIPTVQELAIPIVQEINKAQEQLDKDRVMLNSLKAKRQLLLSDVQLNQQDYHRYSALASQGAVSQQTQEQYNNRLQSARASLGSINAQIQAQEAAVSQAEKALQQAQSMALLNKGTTVVDNF